MKHLSLCFLIISSAFALSAVTGSGGNNVVNSKVVSAGDSITTDSILLIRLTDNIVFNWNNQTGKIVDDWYLHALKKNFSLSQDKLIGMITDTTETAAVACGADQRLSKGNLAFLLLDQVKDLPYAKVLKMQFCVMKPGCPYPSGLFNHLNHSREDAREKVRAYLAEKP